MDWLIGLVALALVWTIGWGLGWRAGTADAATIAAAYHVDKTDCWDVDMLQYVIKQRAWSERAFGPPATTDTQRICTHITKELDEIRQFLGDCEEWVDVIILALDGAWRAGHSPLTIASTLRLKQEKNAARKWVIPSDPTTPIEHDRYEERESNP